MKKKEFIFLGAATGVLLYFYYRKSQNSGFSPNSGLSISPGGPISGTALAAFDGGSETKQTPGGIFYDLFGTSIDAIDLSNENSGIAYDPKDFFSTVTGALPEDKKPVLTPAPIQVKKRSKRDVQDWLRRASIRKPYHDPGGNP